MQRVQLIGLDFGTTTSSAVVAAASIRRNAANARMELSDVQEQFRSEMVFTPFRDGQLDLDRLEAQLDDWLKQGGVEPAHLLGGGALLTGLTAQAGNAEGLVAIIRRRLGGALIARADDPRLESWLAFMGSVAGRSQAHPRQPVLNLDIGGGTTNLALGVAGEVVATGCLFVGARHIQVAPGGYRIEKLSAYALAMFDGLNIRKGPGDEMSNAEVTRVIDCTVALLQAVASGGSAEVPPSLVQLYTQAPLRPSPYLKDAAFTLSGGVGELVYRHLRGEAWPATTAYGDLGIDLARRLADDPFLRDHWRRFQPTAGGRATVFGLLRHSTQVSGSTVFLKHPADLPLRDLPILGTIDRNSPLAEFIDLAKRSPGGAAFRIEAPGLAPAELRAFAGRIAEALRDADYPPGQPLVLFAETNIGKVLGQYVTNWGEWPWHLLVIDEINCHNAQYAHVGAMRDQVIPVSFFGLQGESGA